MANIHFLKKIRKTYQSAISILYFSLHHHFFLLKTTDFSASLLSGSSSLNLKVFKAVWLNNKGLYLRWRTRKLFRAVSFDKGSFIQYARKIFWKTNISYPLIHTCTCVYQGVRNVRFWENFEYKVNEWSPTFPRAYGQISIVVSTFDQQYKQNRKSSERKTCYFWKIVFVIILVIGKELNLVWKSMKVWKS